MAEGLRKRWGWVQWCGAGNFYKFCYGCHRAPRVACRGLAGSGLQQFISDVVVLDVVSAMEGVQRFMAVGQKEDPVAFPGPLCGTG